MTRDYVPLAEQLTGARRAARELTKLWNTRVYQGRLEPARAQYLSDVQRAIVRTLEAIYRERTTTHV